MLLEKGTEEDIREEERRKKDQYMHQYDVEDGKEQQSGKGLSRIVKKK